MQDRVPVNPGRVLITPENGSAAYYATMTRADNPTQEGTPLNKASLLKDATAALFGLGASAVPDDVFAVLSRFQSGLGNEYLWEKNKKEIVIVGDSNEKGAAYNKNSYTDWQYSSSVSEVNGAIKLDNPSTGSSSISIKSFTELIVGKYCTQTNLNGGNIFYVESAKNDGEQIVYVTYRTVEIKRTVYGYVNSPDPNAYPVNDGYTYNLLGQLGAKAQIATGSYTGTGTYGAGNPNSLTFDFVPKMIIAIYGGKAYNGGLYYPILMLLNPLDAWVNSYSGNSGIGGAKTVVTWSDNTVSWYSTEAASSQLNDSGTTCHYIAIG